MIDERPQRNATPGFGSPIPASIAFATWLGAWLFGSFIVAGALFTLYGLESGDTQTVGEIAGVLVVGWAVFLGAAWWVSKHAGTGDPVTDLGIRFTPIDLVGIPAGIAAQLLLIPALYWPLRELWPTTFSDDAISERSSEIVDNASGASLLLLGVLLVVGAPFVEEIIYRGLLQRSFANAVGRVGALVLIAALFALIHFSPVEMPGLFAAGLVFGAGLVLTGRIGAGIIAHMAFNATALVALL